MKITRCIKCSFCILNVSMIAQVQTMLVICHTQDILHWYLHTNRSTIVCPLTDRNEMQKCQMVYARIVSSRFLCINCLLTIVCRPFNITYIMKRNTSLLHLSPCCYFFMKEGFVQLAQLHWSSIFLLPLELISHLFPN